jgi:hypothetical protein
MVTTAEKQVGSETIDRSYRVSKCAIRIPREVSPIEMIASEIGAEWLALQRGDAPLTSNQEWDDVPFQRWYRFKEAFSPLFVRDALHQAEQIIGRPVETCLDPFGGSGTTALTSQFLGVRPTTIEVNPFLADLIAAKLTTYDPSRILVAHTALHAELAEAINSACDAFPGAPATFIEPGVNDRWIFDRNVAQRIADYRRAIDRLQDPEAARLFRVMLGSVLLGLSNVVVSGKGRRYRQPSRRSLATVESVDDRFQAALESAVDDAWRFSCRRCTSFSLMRGDARRLINTTDAADVVLFSPPYPNSFDYTDIYNVELWTLGYLTSPTENRILRASTLRSHVQILRDYSHPDIGSVTLNRTITALQALRSELWNPHLPAMVGAYFADLVTILRACRDRLTSRGVIMVVIGDSRYAGVQIDVTQIVQELLPQEGLRCRSVTEVRSMRTSAQQGGAIQLRETLLVIDRQHTTPPTSRGRGHSVS